MQIGKILKDETVYITGGGTYNTFLCNRIKKYSNSKIIIADPLNLEFKEAMIFGFLGVLKDSALVSILGYIELLKASQILMTRTQEAILILSIAGAFYFALSYPISYYATRLEKRWSE